MKKFTGAPFGSQSARFVMKGMHPKLSGSELMMRSRPTDKATTTVPTKAERLLKLRKKTTIQTKGQTATMLTQMKQAEEATKLARMQAADKHLRQRRKRIVRDLKQLKKAKVRGIDWKITENVERWTKTPYVLNFDQHQLDILQKSRMGPGRYRTRDPFRITKCKATPGVMHTKVPRFFTLSKQTSSTPGPGTYGDKPMHPGDITPIRGKHTYMESCGSHTVPLMTGSGLAPGTYFNRPGELEYKLPKATGSRGPYDVFNDNRLAPIRIGWLANKERFDYTDHHYTPPSLLQRMMQNNLTGKFPYSTHSSRPLGRIVIENSEHDWATKLDVDYHDAKPIVKSFQGRKFAFNSSKPRFDMQYIQRFTVNYNLCGPGRYNISKKPSSAKKKELKASNRFSKFPIPNLKPINMSIDERKQHVLLVDRQC